MVIKQFAARLSEQFLDDGSLDVSQAEIAAAVAVGEPLVIEAQQVQDRGVQVVDVDAAFDSVTAEVVADAVPVAGLLADLKQRDMLKDTLVVWAGEFGRTPFAQFDNAACAASAIV